MERAPFLYRTSQYLAFSGIVYAAIALIFLLNPEFLLTSYRIDFTTETIVDTRKFGGLILGLVTLCWFISSDAFNGLLLFWAVLLNSIALLIVTPLILSNPRGVMVWVIFFVFALLGVGAVVAIRSRQFWD